MKTMPNQTSQTVQPRVPAFEIGLFEVVASDFSQSLAEMEAGEESAVGAYEFETKENEITKVTKE